MGGGNGNTASGDWATVAGGWSNTASGDWATVAGGELNEATGQYSFAAGSNAKAKHDGCFVWADGSSSDFTSTGVNQFLISALGGVGIGTTNPGSYKLAVEGKIGAREVVVTQAGWSDYVFDDKYELPSLVKVESYIKENKHLPDIPSAKEIKEKGLSVSDMLAKQMQKIEELTLYLIQLKKENEDLKSRVAALERQK